MAESGFEAKRRRRRFGVGLHILFLGQGGHLKRDLPILLEQVRAAHPECEITLAAAVGESASVIAAMADYATGCAV